MTDTPVVLIRGARQVGKSTLAQAWVEAEPTRRYVTLDDASFLQAARLDPVGFVAGLSGPTAIDEVQRVPELLLALKANVDRQRSPGRFLLTGSADVLMLPKVADALTGRMEVLSMYPLSQGELRGRVEGFIDGLFSSKVPSTAQRPGLKTDVFQLALLGGYPEVLARKTDARQQAWFESYLATLLERDVRELANIEALTALPRLMSLLAARSATLLNASEFSRSTTVPLTSLRRYLSLLEMTFLATLIPAWHNNRSKRWVKAPKLFLTDSGLMSHLLSMDMERLKTEAILRGPLLETFVCGELRKQLTWSQVRPALYHFRTLTGQEVDFVLEDRKGRIVGVEVKASATAKPEDFKGLKVLQQEAGERFVRGVVLYTGDQTVPFAENLHALPVSALWSL